MGETDDDIIDLALTLREMNVRSVPVNFLIPIPGTPLEAARQLDPRRCLRVLCLFRFLLPSQEIRIAGGREVHLRSLQPLGLYPANSMFVGDYLTTPGQAPSADFEMIRDMGFVLETPDGAPWDGDQMDGLAQTPPWLSRDTTGVTGPPGQAVAQEQIRPRGPGAGSLAG